MGKIFLGRSRCFQWFKDTNLKANHNSQCFAFFLRLVVSNGSKILIWKQITTTASMTTLANCCFQWFKDTNLKANHNTCPQSALMVYVVSNGSKILIWKQITTPSQFVLLNTCCFQWFKDTNLKANHNNWRRGSTGNRVVSNGSKILIWKQITTGLIP